MNKTQNIAANNSLARNRFGKKQKQTRKKHKNHNRNGCSNLTSVFYEIYRCWNNMIQRCYNPKATGYTWYGGNQIGVCELWQDFANFKIWCEINNFKKGMSVDRLDETKDYSPENCRLVLSNNNRKFRSNTKYYVYEHEIISFTELIKREEFKEFRKIIRIELKNGTKKDDIVKFLVKYSNRIIIQFDPKKSNIK